ncbi:Flap endonuclease [Trichinella spiralis]|uniref:Flap endonuclease n=1 Tax=Trichinella spiralis TaxID=6334 RepID=A0ABR3KIC4_TRISP
MEDWRILDFDNVDLMLWLVVLAIFLHMARYLLDHWETSREKEELIQFLNETHYNMGQVERIVEHQQSMDNKDYIGEPYLFYNPDKDVFTLQIDFNNLSEDNCIKVCLAIWNALVNIDSEDESEESDE